MTISVKHMFERRLGSFPTFFDRDGEMYVYTGSGDFPFKLSTRKIKSPEELFPKWMLLCYNKTIQVSSELTGHSKEYATDEEIRTCWSANTGNKGEWITMDLQKSCTINAVQINYAENETKIFGRSPGMYYQYLLEYSSDNKKWKTLVDTTNNTTDVPHDYIELKQPVKARYVRVSNCHMLSGTFALTGLRIFGNGGGKAPGVVQKFNAVRSQGDGAIVQLSWNKLPGAVGYNI